MHDKNQIEREQSKWFNGGIPLDVHCAHCTRTYACRHCRCSVLLISFQTYLWLSSWLYIAFSNAFHTFLYVKAIYYSFTYFSLLRSNKLRFANEFFRFAICVWFEYLNIPLHEIRDNLFDLVLCLHIEALAFLKRMCVCMRVHLKSFILSIYICRVACYIQIVLHSCFMSIFVLHLL